MITKTGKALSTDLAWTLCANGVWVTTGGYTYRNVPGKKCGQFGEYLAYGDYPGSIRGCQAHTRKGMEFYANGKKRVWYLSWLNKVKEAKES